MNDHVQQEPARASLHDAWVGERAAALQSNVFRETIATHPSLSARRLPCHSHTYRYSFRRSQDSPDYEGSYRPKGVAALGNDIKLPRVRDWVIKANLDLVSLTEMMRLHCPAEGHRVPFLR